MLVLDNNNYSQVQQSFTYMCWMFFLFMKSSTLPFLAVRVLLQSVEYTIRKLEIKSWTANITCCKTWWELQKKQDRKCENTFINRCTELLQGQRLQQFGCIWLLKHKGLIKLIIYLFHNLYIASSTNCWIMFGNYLLFLSRRLFRWSFRGPQRICWDIIMIKTSQKV